MKKLKFAFGLIFILLTNACGQSVEEIESRNKKEIENAKSMIDDQFALILEEYYSANENLDKIPPVYKIESYKKSKHEEVSKYAQKVVDSIPKLKKSLEGLIYGDLFEYAQKQGWDDLTKSDFDKIENANKVKGDEFSKAQLYRHPSSPKYINQDGFFLYYQKGNVADGDPDLILKAQYYDDSWLFIESAEVSVDGDVYKLNFKDWDRDNSGGMIYEWGIERKPRYYLIIKIIESKSAKIRYHGDKYYDDRTITPAQKKALKSILQAYYGLYVKK